MTTAPSTGPKPFVFVVMPFHPSFGDVYTLGIKPVVAEAGAYAERVDEQQYEGRILDRIINQIAKADIVVADMTGRNPNVLYEVGYAHALNKLVIPLTQKLEDIPFDLKQHPHVVYSSVTELRSTLKPWLSWAIQTTNTRRGHSIVCPVDGYVNSVRIASGGEPATVVQVVVRRTPLDLQLQIKNVSGAPIRDPITHTYLLLEPDAVMRPVHIFSNGTYGDAAEPVLVHHTPDVDRFTHRYRLVFTPLAMPAHAVESFVVPMAFVGLMPRLCYIRALLEVLVADNVFRFRFDLQCVT